MLFSIRFTTAASGATCRAIYLPIKRCTNTFDGGNTRAFGNRFMMPCGRTCGYLWANNRKRVRVQLKVAVQIKLHSEKDPTAGASATEAKTTIDGADG
jgi:hypothetical protein